MVNLTIDNQKIQSPAGKKILEAALENGIEIPHLCYHPELKAFGGCRLCLVEVKGEKELVSSCVMSVEEGMEVHTDTPRIQRARRTIVQLLLLNHPLDCLVCERGGNCMLQKLAFDLQIKPDVYKMKKRITKGKQKRAILEIDPKKCVHCGLCVRACKEIRHYGAIDFYNRGFKTDIGIPFHDESHCELCGQCIEVCPVAGVVGLDSKYIARPWELEHTHTICPYCGTGCLITLNTKLNKVVRISSEDKNGVNKGKICVKGRFGYGFISSEERLTSPLIKKNGKFHKVSWDEAIAYISHDLKEIIDNHGANAVAGLGSVKATNEDNYLFQKFLRAVVGTNNIDNYTRLEHSPTITGLTETLGLVTMNNGLDQIGKSELIFVIGSNPSDSHPIVSLHIKESLDAGVSKLIVADPRKTKLVSKQEQWLPINPGTDMVLLGGIMYIIINDTQFDRQAIEGEVQNFEAFKESLKAYTPKTVAKITGVSEERLTDTAKTIAGAKSLSIIYSSGITQHINGTQNVAGLADLLMLTGHAYQEESGIYPLRSDSNSQGACDMGTLPDYLPGYQRIDDASVREKFEQAWGKELPATAGLTSDEMFNAIKEGKIKALYVMGDNPAHSYPNSHFIQEALDSLDLLVVQDLFLSQTAQLADVVLPAASFAERWGSITNMERRVQLIVRGVPSPGEALPDWRIIAKLSEKMGYPMDYKSPNEIMKEINGLVPIYGGITYPRLRRSGIFWPCADETAPGTKFLKPHWECGEKPKFASLPQPPTMKIDDKTYHFKLIVGGSLYHSSGGTVSTKSNILKDVCPPGSVTINPEDAADLGVAEGDIVKITSERGALEATATIVSLNPKGIIFVPRHLEDLPIQEIMPDQHDPVSHVPAMKMCMVNLAKV